MTTHCLHTITSGLTDEKSTNSRKVDEWVDEPIAGHPQNPVPCNAAAARNSRLVR